MEGLPNMCKIPRLGAARIKEIKALVNKLGNCEHGGRAFQNLPRHMQRRTVSKNSQRLPRYLQQKHLREIGDNVKITKRPKKKYRYRPYNLLAEYNRRQLDNMWLETHIWHAKRFKMTKKWGYSLAVSPTMKGYRATIRAATKTCTVQDVSYMCCIELQGTKGSLLSGLSALTQPPDFTKLETPHVLQGKKWLSVTLYRPRRQPYGAVANVDIIFHPKPGGQEEFHDTDTLNFWIWVHPSAYDDVVQILNESYNLLGENLNKPEDKVEGQLNSDSGEYTQPMEVEQKTEADNPLGIINGDANWEVKEGNKGSQKRFVNEAKIAKKNIPVHKAPKYFSPESGVTMTLLKDTINRFELTGPLAYSVLHAALVPVNMTVEKAKNAKGEPWWKGYYQTERMEHMYKKQLYTWTRLSSTPPNVVVPLTIRDPRMSLPYKKLPLQKVTTDKSSPNIFDWPTECPFFSNIIRDEVTQTKEPDSVINRIRSENLVPGDRNVEKPMEAKIPVLLISRPESHSAGHGAGWDIFIPAGWAVNVWMSIIFCGGVAVGQREALNVIKEALTPMPPYLMPDTPAAERYSTCQGQERREEYFNKPPLCRQNFIKLRVQYPFSSPWRKLVTSWKPESKDFYVLRDQAELRKIAVFCGDASRKLKPMSLGNKRKFVTSTDIVPSKSVKLNLDSKDICKVQHEDMTRTGSDTDNLECQKTSSIVEAMLENLQKIPSETLILVRLEVEGKGTIEQCAMISMPVIDDLKARILRRKPTHSCDVEELPQEDTKADERDLLQKEHGKIGRKLQRLRKKARKSGENSSKTDTGGEPNTENKANQEICEADAHKKVEDENKDIIAKYSQYSKAMEEAWLISKEDPLQCCSRKIMGYVIAGGFFHTLGYGAGISWVCMEPLIQLLHLHVKFITEIANDPEFKDVHEKEKSLLQPLVLVRCPTTLSYRWARLTVILQPE